MTEQGIQLTMEQTVELVNVLQSDLNKVINENRILKTNVNLLAKEVNRLNQVIQENVANETPEEYSDEGISQDT